MVFAAGLADYHSNSVESGCDHHSPDRVDAVVICRSAPLNATAEPDRMKCA
jgi:hypothetical protein